MSHEPRRRSRDGWWIAGLVLAAIVVGLTAAGMWAFKSFGPVRDRTETAEYDDVTALDFTGDSGDITITAAEGDTVELTRVLRWRGDEPPKSVESVRDGTLRVEQRGCPSGLGGECWIDYRLAVPPDTAVELDQDAGSVRTSGITGEQRLSLDSGELTFDKAAGDVTVVSDAATVNASELESGSVSVSQDAGDVELDFATVPSRVKVEQDAGNIDIALPETESYAVDATTDAGNVEVSVGKDKSSSHTVKAHSAAGEVTVRQR